MSVISLLEDFLNNIVYIKAKGNKFVHKKKTNNLENPVHKTANDSQTDVK